MKERITLWLLATFFLASVSLADAQQTRKVPRIGFLDTSTASGSAVLVDAFRQELSKLGWIEGKNVTIEYRFAEGKGTTRLSELAGDLVRLKVDLIVVADTPSSLAAKNATTTIPIVMVGVGDPWPQVWLRVLRGREAMSPVSRIFGRAKYQEAGATHGRGPQARPSWTSAAGWRTDRQLKNLRAAALALKLKLEEIETQRDAKV